MYGCWLSLFSNVCQISFDCKRKRGESGFSLVFKVEGREKPRQRKQVCVGFVLPWKLSDQTWVDAVHHHPFCASSRKTKKNRKRRATYTNVQGGKTVAIFLPKWIDLKIEAHASKTARNLDFAIVLSVCVCCVVAVVLSIYPFIYTTPARCDSLLLLLLSLFGSLWRSPSSCPCHPCAMQNLLRLFVKQPTKTILPDGGDQHNNGKDR